MQPATTDPTLGSMHKALIQGRVVQMGSLPDTSAHDQGWESNPRPFDLKGQN